MNLKSIYMTEYKLKTFINDLRTRYIPSDFSYNILFDRHFINRFYDRSIPAKDISKIISKISTSFVKLFIMSIVELKIYTLKMKA